ncbi:hypothetical protein GCM10027570_08830 [Streptomonospora sediminis]
MDGIDVAGLSVESVDVVSPESPESLESGQGMTEVATSCPCGCTTCWIG